MNINCWDIIYGCSENALNSLLEKGSDAFCISGEKQFEIGGKSAVFNFKLTKWKITSGGSGKEIMFLITHDVVIGLEDENTLSFSNIVSLVRIPLGLINSDMSTMKIILGSDSQKPMVNNYDTTNVMGGQFSDSEVFFKTALEELIDEKSKELKYMFAAIMGFENKVINMNNFTYAWHQPLDLKFPGYLAIMAKLDNTDISGFPIIIDPNLLYTNGKLYDVVFMISGKKFLESSMLPELPIIFPGSSIDQYKMSGDGSIVNNGRITLNYIKPAAIKYFPYINDFKSYISDGSIVVEANGSCKIEGLTDAYINFSLTSKNQARYSAKSNQIVFENDPNFTVNTSESIPAWEKFIGILSLGILNLVEECIADSMEESLSQRLNGCKVNYHEIGINCVNWPSNVSFTDGGLSDNVYARGNLIL